MVVKPGLQFPITKTRTRHDAYLCAGAYHPWPQNCFRNIDFTAMALPPKIARREKYMCNTTLISLHFALKLQDEKKDNQLDSDCCISHVISRDNYHTREDYWK